ncbi:MAG: amidohydrolase, partial [Syntrophomonadaceae bacterium]|nr:amidohydrolase [Syntrophomonadaceae bacterium]
MNIHQEVNELKGEIVALRRDFHMYPEIGFEEYRTAEVVTKYLTECGMEVKRVAKTGVVGLLRGKETGKTILLRADMDALPVEELN